MLKIDAGKLAEALRKTSPCPKKDPRDEMSGGMKHVYDAICVPYRNGETPRLSALDFAAFSFEDMEELETLFDRLEGEAAKTRPVIDALEKAKPARALAAGLFI